jgi:hypothetical protein
MRRIELPSTRQTPHHAHLLAVAHPSGSTILITGVSGMDRSLAEAPAASGRFRRSVWLPEDVPGLPEAVETEGHCSLNAYCHEEAF